MTKIIGIISGKGGVGKTTSAINLGSALNFFGKDVTVVDAILTTPNIGVYLGVPVAPVTIHHVLQGKNHISDSIYLHPSGTKIVPGSIALKDLSNIDPGKLKNKMLDLVGLTDICLIDGAAGLGKEAISAIEASDELLIVTNPELPAITDALKAVKLAEKVGIPIIGAILTRVKLDGLDMTITNVEEMLEVPVLGVIPEDTAVRKAMVSKNTIIDSYPKSSSSIAYKKLAAKLIGEDYQEDINQKKTKTIIDAILSIFRK